MKYIKLYEDKTQEDIKTSAINFYKRLDKVKGLGSNIEDMFQAMKDDYNIKHKV